MFVVSNCRRNRRIRKKHRVRNSVSSMFPRPRAISFQHTHKKKKKQIKKTSYVGKQEVLKGRGWLQLQLLYDTRMCTKRIHKHSWMYGWMDGWLKEEILHCKGIQLTVQQQSTLVVNVNWESKRKRERWNQRQRMRVFE